MGRHAIGFADRGADRVVTVPFGVDAQECVGCGACAQVCPTGAITCEDVDGVRIIEAFGTELPLAKCRVCRSFFTTEKHLKLLKEKSKLPAELLETCSRCREAAGLNAMSAPDSATGAGLVHYGAAGGKSPVAGE
jgi:ferredoxin